jgi:hypothetical protein
MDPLLDRRASEPAVRTALIAFMWFRWPPSAGSPFSRFHAEARAEQRGLDVVRRDRVAAEEHVDVPVADHLREVRAAPRVDDRGTGDDQDLPAAPSDLAHLARDLLDRRASSASPSSPRCS